MTTPTSRSSTQQVDVSTLFQQAHEFLAKKETEKAKKVFLEAALNGCLDSHYNLGKLYEEDGNDSKAMHHYEIAASKNDPDATYNLAFLHQKRKEFDRAVTLYQPLATENIDAAFNTALCFQALHKHGKAAAYFKIAADLGDPEAQFALATYFETGLGGIPQLEEARKYYRLALKNGIEKAQEALNRLSTPLPR